MGWLKIYGLNLPKLSGSKVSSTGLLVLGPDLDLLLEWNVEVSWR